MSKKDRNFEFLKDRPGHLIRRLHQIHVAIFLEECEQHNLTPVQFGVLTVLGDDAVRDQVTIAQMIGVDRNTAADVIRRLANRGLLTRPENVKDKRTKLAKITELGKQLVKDVEPGMISAQLKLTSVLSEDEYSQFMRLALKLVNANDHNSRAPWKPSLQNQQEETA